VNCFQFFDIFDFIQQDFLCVRMAKVSRRNLDLKNALHEHFLNSIWTKNLIVLK